MFTIKELASMMSCPIVSSLQHLRKLVGFMKSIGDVWVKLQIPQPGIGKMQSGGSHAWVLESFSDADWFEQEPQEEHVLRYPYAERMFHVWFKQKPEGDLFFKLRA